MSDIKYRRHLIEAYEGLGEYEDTEDTYDNRLQLDYLPDEEEKPKFISTADYDIALLRDAYLNVAGKSRERAATIQAMISSIKSTGTPYGLSYDNIDSEITRVMNGLSPHEDEEDAEDLESEE